MVVPPTVDVAEGLLCHRGLGPRGSVCVTLHCRARRQFQKHSGFQIWIVFCLTDFKRRGGGDAETLMQRPGVFSSPSRGVEEAVGVPAQSDNRTFHPLLRKHIISIEDESSTPPHGVCVYGVCVCMVCVCVCVWCVRGALKHSNTAWSCVLCLKASTDRPV